MHFKKIKISIRCRLRELIHGIDWLATTTIPICGDGYYYESTLDFRERWECFLSCIETAIIGYMWGLEKNEEEKNK